jgi:inorganic phosphate transporter, PiT family
MQTVGYGRRINAVSTELIILVLLIVTALAFDFTNGFHDTGNAMATSIATGALKPKTAVLLAGVLNLVGAFLSVEVAVTVTTSVLKVQDSKSGELLPGIERLRVSRSSSPASSAASCGTC